MAIKKVKLPDNTTQDIQDSRISGVDTAPTSGSSNLVTSGGVDTALSSKADDSEVVHKAGDTMTGALNVPTISLTSTSATGHLNFSRSNYNFITAPSGGYFSFLPEGGDPANGIDDSPLCINSTRVFPGTADTISIGSNQVYYARVYSKELNATSPTGGTIVLSGNSTSTSNISAGSIEFYSRTSRYNGAKIASVHNGTYDRQDLVFYTSDDAANTTTWIEAMRLSKAGNVTIGTTSAPKTLTVTGDLTVASPSNVAFSSTSNTLADIIPNITVSSSEPTSSQGSDGDIWIVV